MSNHKETPHNISDAVKRLESATKSSNGGSNNRQLAEDFETIKKALADLTPHLQQLKEDATKAASDALREPLEQAKEKFKQSSESVKDFGKEIDQQVHEHPWLSLGIVGLVAFLIGFLLGRKD